MTNENFVVANARFSSPRALVLALLAVGMLVFGAARADAANTLQVAPTGSDSGNCVGAPCATIAYAVGQAAASDTIQIAAGNYDEQIEITVPGLTLQGAPNLATVIGPEGSGVVEQTEITLADGVDGVTLSDLAVHSSAQGKPAILAAGPGAIDGLTIDGVAVSGIGPSTPPTTVGNGLEVKAPGAGWKIVDSSFAYHYLGLVVFSDMTDFTVEGSSFDANRAGFYVERTLPLTADSTGEIDGLEITDTSFDHNEYVALYFEGLKNGVIEDVTVTDTGVGVGALPNGARAIVVNLKAGPGGPLAVTDSTFSGSVHEGILVQARGWAGDSAYEAAPASLAGFTLTGSTVTGNGGPGVIVNNRSTLSGAEIHGNRIAQNGTVAYNVTAPVDGVFARNEADGAPSVDAGENWFACNAGPAAAGCANVNAPVEAPVWLVLTVGTAFETLRPGQQTAVVAAIESSAGGDSVLPFPEGAEALFSSSLGSFEPASEPLLSGVASPTFTAGATLGSGAITASVDGEQATTPITVLAPETVPEPSRPAPAPPAPEPPAPPTIDPAGDKGPTVVPDSGKVTIATISCAAESCAVKTQGEPSVKIGGKSFKVQVKLPKNLGDGDSAKVRVVLPKKVREALAAEGKGKLTLKLRVTGSDGSVKTVTVKIVLKGKGGKAKSG